MRPPFKFGVLLLCTLLYIIDFTQALHTFNAHRMLQVETPNAKLGSQKAVLNLVASAPSLDVNSSLAKTIAIVPFETLTLQGFNDIIHTRKAEGILVLLPEKIESVSQNVIDNWTNLEQELLKLEVPVPVYFAPADDHLKGVYENVVKHGDSSAGDKYQLVASSDVSVLKDPSVVNFQGWLAGSPSTDESGKKPTIAVVAFYDSFGIAPGMSTGVDSNGSGVISVLELARIFSKLYSDVKTKGKYNIVFVLTGAGSLNYAGASKWIEERSNAGALDSVDFALCLDSLAGDELYLHISRPAKDPATQKLYNAFTNTAEKMNIPLSLLQRKINIASSEIFWEHEAFARKKTFAATLSHRSSPSGPLSRAGLLDGKVNVTQLTKNIRFAGEALANYIYGLEGGILLHEDGAYGVLPQRVEAWSLSLSSLPRASPFLSSSSPFLSQLEQELKQFTTDVSRESYALEDENKYFNPISSTMTAYRAKPYTFDLFFSIIVAAYLLGVYALMKGDQFIPSLQALIFGSPKKKN